METSPLRFPLAVALATLTGAAAADPVTGILAAAEADCATLDGAFDAGEAVVEADLDGIDPTDRLVDTSRFTCSTSASLYCGSGGCTLHAVVGDESWGLQSEGWRLIDWDGRPILLVARDGGWCGGVGAAICFEAVSWSDGRMMTVKPDPG
jgi:hypothetical protein